MNRFRSIGLFEQAEAAKAEQARQAAAAARAAADAAEKAKVAKSETLAAQVAAHQKALAERQALLAAISKLQPTWQPLPVAPYPPAGDTSGFPQMGTPSLAINSSSISAAQRAEPAKQQAAIYAQAKARRPKLTSIFWVGLAALGVGIYLSRH